MQRNKAIYPLAEGQAQELKKRMLEWANHSSILLYLDSNQYPSEYAGYECLIACGQINRLSYPADCDDILTTLQQLHEDNKDWIFGHISYDYKTVILPRLSSDHHDGVVMPVAHFFIPETVCTIDRQMTMLTIESVHDSAAIYDQITAASLPECKSSVPIEFTPKVDRQDYIATIERLRQHIADGDCYEINYCVEGFSEHRAIDPLSAFHKLNALSPAPFAAYYQLGDKYMLCASPERYLRKEGDLLLSQPIKGTARRGRDYAADEQIKQELFSSIKERAENVMIVDLVRNDLARSCKTGSIHVPELFGIYTFPQVHQMISTVTGILADTVPFTDALRYSFPVGSMTGAPKYKVMLLTEQYERSRRGLYAGTVGYINPEGDFDFNVVIRSLFYNAGTQYLSYHTGGAITYDSVPEQEWEEMRLKAWALERIFRE